MKVQSNYEKANYTAFILELSPNYLIENDKEKEKVNKIVNKLVIARE